MSYLCQNMKLFANKLGKLRLFWFFDYSLKKKEKFHLPPSDKPPPPSATHKKNFLRGLGVTNFHK